jgi:hypothetical protein
MWTVEELIKDKEALTAGGVADYRLALHERRRLFALTLRIRGLT